MANVRAILIVPLAMAGCGISSFPDAPPPGFVPSGYVCSLSPSAAYAPGYLYRVDGSGAELLVRDLRQQARTSTYQAALGTYDATVTRGGGLNFQLLRPISSVGGGADLSGSRTQTTKVSFADGQYSLMTDDDAAAIVEAAGGEFVPRSDSRYFIVRDAIQARGVEIKLTTGDEAKLGGEASVSELATSKPNFSLTRDENLTVSGTFEEPLNVCIRAMAVEPVPEPSEPAPVSEPSGPTPVSEAVEWRLVARYANPSDTLQILNATE